MIITIIIVNFNSSTDLLEAVDSVEQSQTPQGFTRKLVIVDNSTREGEWETIQSLLKYEDLELIKNPSNTGFPGANNLVMKKDPQSDYFLLLNPDTKVREDFLVELMKPFLNGHSGKPCLPAGRRSASRIYCDEREMFIASPKILFYPGFEFHKDRYQKKDLGKVIWYGGGKLDWNNVVASHVDVDKVDHVIARTPTKVIGTKQSHIYEIPLRQSAARDDTRPTDFCTGCCLLIPKETIQKIGLLDEKLFFSWEDADYSLRVRAAGGRVLYVPNSIIWHKNANTSGGAGSKLQDFYQTRNRLIIAFRYAKWKVKILLLIQLLKSANSNRLRAIFSALQSLSCPFLTLLI